MALAQIWNFPPDSWYNWYVALCFWVLLIRDESAGKTETYSRATESTQYAMLFPIGLYEGMYFEFLPSWMMTLPIIWRPMDKLFHSQDALLSYLQQRIDKHKDHLSRKKLTR